MADQRGITSGVCFRRTQRSESEWISPLEEISTLGPSATCCPPLCEDICLFRLLGTGQRGPSSCMLRIPFCGLPRVMLIFPPMSQIPNLRLLNTRGSKNRHCQFIWRNPVARNVLAGHGRLRLPQSIHGKRMRSPDASPNVAPDVAQNASRPTLISSAVGNSSRAYFEELPRGISPGRPTPSSKNAPDRGPRDKFGEDVGRDTKRGPIRGGRRKRPPPS